jgi:hypothetical protein
MGVKLYQVETKHPLTIITCRGIVQQIIVMALALGAVPNRQSEIKI